MLSIQRLKTPFVFNIYSKTESSILNGPLTIAKFID